MAREQILRDTKMLLKDEAPSDDELLFLIDDCINAVMAYCRLEILPYQLLGLIAQMAAKRYRAEFNKESGTVISITEGDRKVDFSVPNESSLSEDRKSVV